MNYIDIYAQHLSKEHQVKFAFDLIRDISSCCEKFIITTEKNVVNDEPLEHMAICERLTRLPISALLAYARVIETCGQDTILQQIRRIAWKSKKSIYYAGFPEHVLECLEWFFPRLEFEHKVEGKVVSPSWYIRELIAKAEGENFTTVTKCFHDEAKQFYEHWIDTATSSKHPWLAAVALSNEREYWLRLDHHFNNLVQHWNNLNFDRRLEGLPWPNLNTDELVQKKEQRKKESLKLMSSENVLLSFSKRPESHPDFAGQFLHTVGEALLTAMCENDCDTIETLFKDYFVGSISQYQQLRPEIKKPISHIEYDMKVACAPLMDLMDISGYAFLMSDYHDEPRLKQLIVKEWDHALNKNPPMLSLEGFAVVVSLSESGLSMPHRSINRTRWRQTVSGLFQNLESQEIWTESSFIPETVVKHESPLVRMFADSFDSHDGVDIFLAKYIRQREDGKDLDFGYRRKNLEETLEREDKRYKRGETDVE